MAEELDIRYNTQVVSLEKRNECWLVNNDCFDQVIFCGNIKDLPVLLNNVVDISSFESMIEKLEYHGTTSVFCEIEKIHIAGFIYHQESIRHIVLYVQETFQKQIIHLGY